MNIEELKQALRNYNDNYRRGDDSISDQDYDDLLDSLRDQLHEDEFNSFLNSLHEVDGKYTHPYVMGSLTKVKSEEPDSVFAFLRKYVPSKTLHVSAKIDGISCRLHYEKGTLVGASSRGDGTSGQDLTDKIKFVKGVPQVIGYTDTIDIRGELVIYAEDFKCIDDQFKNARNACAGIMNHVHGNKELLSKVSFVAYEIMGGKYTKHDQFIMLQDMKYTTAYWCQYITNLDKLNQHVIDDLVGIAKQEFPYTTDGLVLSDANYTSENVYRPDGQIAFKINQLKALTKIQSIEWRGPSKDGKFVPVAKIEPTELGGSTISNVTCHNVDYIKKHDLKLGSVVEIVKSGDVIPKIVGLVHNLASAGEIEYPNVCPACGEPLALIGCDIMCVNHACGDKAIFAVSNLIRKIGVDDAAKKSMINWGITTFESLLAFRPTVGSVSENKFYDQLLTKLFTLSPMAIFTKLNFHGLSDKTVSVMIEFYGMSDLRNGTFAGGFPMNVGQTTIDNFLETSEDNFRILDMITTDPRYVYKPSATFNATEKPANRGSVCFTGALTSMTRPVAEAKAMANGWTIGGVNKNLSVLVCNDPTSTSGKMGKAKSLGIKIMTEQEFFANV